MMKKRIKIISLILSFLLLLYGCSQNAQNSADIQTTGQNSGFADAQYADTIDDVPEYTYEPYVILNDNQPEFDENSYTVTAFEKYGDLDSLSRCTAAFACVCTETMPTEERGEIGQIKPTGWHTVKYDCVDGKYLYNRCHLIGYQLTGENANVKNLITGTRYMNTEGMLPFENIVSQYVTNTDNHVLYRVTPVFNEDNLLCDGVQMEALSMEDNGKGVCFNVFCYNVQPGIEIDYKTGESSLIGVTTTAQNNKTSSEREEVHDYVINTNSKKFHRPDCTGVKKMSPKNKKYFTGTRSSLTDNGYSPCSYCNP